MHISFYYFFASIIGFFIKIPTNFQVNKNNIMFKIEKIKSIYLEIYDITKKLYKDNFGHIIFCMSRTVMDFYTIARIIKSDMKKVIIYAGNNHIIRIVYLLTEYLNFQKMAVIE